MPRGDGTGPAGMRSGNCGGRGFGRGLGRTQSFGSGKCRSRGYGTARAPEQLERQAKMLEDKAAQLRQLAKESEGSS